MQPFLLNTDSDPQNQPDKTSRLNINVNINSEIGSITNEDGNYPLFNYPTLTTPGATCIGKIPLSNGSVVLFSVIEGESKIYDPNNPATQIVGRYCRGEIGVLASDNSYRVLIRDKVGATDFNWNLNTQIQGSYKINSDNTFSVYWVDFRNPLRYINVDTPEPAVDLNFQCTDIDEFNKLYVLKPFEQFKINLDSVQNGGNLKSGVYYVLAAYADENFNETNLSFPSNPISIVNETSQFPIENYDGCPAGTLTGKSFTISFSSDINFPNVKLYVISKINQVLSAYDLGYFPNTTGTFTREIISLDNAATTSTDILINKITWVAKTITQLDNRLYIGNLKETLKTNLQPWINNIQVEPYIEIQDRSTFNTSFHSETEIFTKRCFQYDEIYALYATLVYKDGTESEAYHIPGRQAERVSYDGDATTPIISGGVELFDSNGLALNFDEDARLDSIPATYRLNEFGVFCSTLTPIDNKGGTFNTSTNSLTYNVTFPLLGLSTGNIALLKQYNPTGTESYYYVKITGTNITGSLPTFTYTHTVQPVQYVNNANLGVITLWNTISGYGVPGIFRVPAIADNNITNGLTTTDISPAGEIYNINPDSKIFHAFDCGQGNIGSALKLSFWENADETYDNTTDWDVKNSSGTVTTSFKNQKIRHHKMPDPKNIQQSAEIYKTANLGLKISNIILPAELENELDKIKIYYAKRTNSNRSILGQSLILHDFYIYTTGSTEPYVPPQNYLSTEGVFNLSFNNNMVFYSMFQGGLGSGRDRRMGRQLNRVRMSPFDIVSSNLDVSSATHFKAFKKIYAQLDYWGSVGSSAWNNNASNYPTAADARFTCFEETVDFAPKSSSIRRFVNAKLTESLPIYNPSSTLLTGSGSNPANAGQLDFTYNTTHYLSETCVTIETANDIESNCYTGNEELDFLNGVVDPYDSYILKGNICSLKPNMYPSYYTQELVDTGYIETLDASAFSTGFNPSNHFYGGDTFQSLDAFRSTSDLVYAYNMGGWGSTFYTAMQFITLYSAYLETISNVNYKHQGTGIYDIYYPKSDSVSVIKVPLLPNGFANYYGYNRDYTSVNDLRAPIIHSFLSTKIDTFPTRIAISAVDNPESVQDNLRIFLPNEYTDVEKSKGEITNITNFGNSLVIQHTHTLKRTATKDRMKTDSSEAYLGAGDLFDYPAKDIMLTDTGYAGLKHQFSSITNQYGVFYVDVNSASIILYGEKLSPVSDNGVKLFTRSNLKLNFESYLRDAVFSLTTSYVEGSTYNQGYSVKYNNAIYLSLINSNTSNPTNSDNWSKIYNYDGFYFDGQDSVFYGYISGFDPLYKRFLVTKKDIVVTESFTLNFHGYFDIDKFVNDWGVGALFMFEGKLYAKASGAGTDIVKFYTDGTTSCYGSEIYFNNPNYFTEDRFTLAYYPEYDGFVSWYENSQDNYFSNQLKFWSQHNKVAFEQNKKEYPYLLSYGGSKALENISDSRGTLSIEPILNGKEVSRLMSVQWKTKALDIASNEEVLQTFDSLQAYDSYQISKVSDIVNQSNSRNIEGYWSNNDFRDYTFDNSSKVVNNNVWYRPFIDANIAVSKHWTKLKRLVDYWFGIRFKYVLSKETPLTITASSYIVPNDVSQDNISSTSDIALATVETINIGDVLKFSCSLSGQDFVIYGIVVYGGYPSYGMKFYNTLPFTSTNLAVTTTITAASIVTKKPKLNLLDISGIKIKNIR